MRIAVVGSTGFVGSEVVNVLNKQGHEVLRVKAPRVPSSLSERGNGLESGAVELLVSKFFSCDAVINCSGNPDASEDDLEVLMAANAISPALVARASNVAGVGRLIHVSSAVVQGRRSRLDQTDETEEFSSYSKSKAEGERRVRREFEDAVIYRPPSVHAEGRRVTVMTARIAASPLASVASPGRQHSPQALLANVASAIAFLAASEKAPPAIVIHPWEGLTTRDLMELLGGKRPMLIPQSLALLTCRGLRVASFAVKGAAANVRRVEMLWFGQRQAESWLSVAGWKPPLGRDAWKSLGEEIRTRAT